MWHTNRCFSGTRLFNDCLCVFAELLGNPKCSFWRPFGGLNKCHPKIQYVQKPCFQPYLDLQRISLGRRWLPPGVMCSPPVVVLCMTTYSEQMELRGGETHFPKSHSLPSNYFQHHNLYLARCGLASQLR